MKRVLRWILLILGIVVLLVGIFLLFVYLRGIPNYEVNVPEIEEIEYTEERWDRGQKLVNLVCRECHSPLDKRILEGRKLSELPPIFGEIYSANITHHPKSKLTPYSDAELVYLLRTGITRDGRYLPAYMPKFPRMSDEDVKSVVTYLRADSSRLVQASDNFTPDSKPGMLVKFLATIKEFKPMPYPEELIPEPDTSDKVEWGRYLANGVVDCYTCHSKNFTTNNDLHPPKSVGFYGGGNKILDPRGNMYYSTNLTQHQSGLKHWTLEQFKKAVRSGIRPKGMEPMSQAMPRFTSLTDEECEAIWAYLQTVPEIPEPEVVEEKVVTDQQQQ